MKSKEIFDVIDKKASFIYRGHESIHYMPVRKTMFVKKHTLVGGAINKLVNGNLGYPFFMVNFRVVPYKKITGGEIYYNNTLILIVKNHSVTYRKPLTKKNFQGGYSLAGFINSFIDNIINENDLNIDYERERKRKPVREGHGKAISKSGVQKRKEK